MKSHTNPEIIKLALGEMSTNCYIVYCPKTREAVIIDPADEAEYITNVILENELHPKKILLTHGHFDHVLGLLELQLNFDIPSFIHKNDLELIKTASQSAKHWLSHPVDPVPTPTNFFEENDVILFGECALKVMETFGHTKGSVSFVSLGSNPMVFVGDTVFKDGVGRTDFSYSNPLQLMKSIDKLCLLDEDTIVYSGHGEETKVIFLRKYD